MGRKLASFYPTSAIWNSARLGASPARSNSDEQSIKTSAVEVGGNVLDEPLLSVRKMRANGGDAIFARPGISALSFEEHRMEKQGAFRVFCCANKVPIKTAKSAYLVGFWRFLAHSRITANLAAEPLFMRIRRFYRGATLTGFEPVLVHV